MADPHAPPLDVDRLDQALSRHPTRSVSGDDPQRAAVALVFDPALRLLFIRRSEHEGDPWSGHMALPGGRVEPDDAGPRAAAVRETLEEVGLDLGPARYLGALDELASPVRKGRRRLVVHPFAFAVPDVPALVLNEEVARVHWIGLSRLLAGEGRGRFDLGWEGRTVAMPVIHIGDADIWGLTLRIVDDLAARLQEAIPPLPGAR